ncbi:ABC-type sugar transport system, periplasmic component, partial [human gut metagenome]
SDVNVDGTIYGLATGANANGFVYNKEVFDLQLHHIIILMMYMLQNLVRIRSYHRTFYLSNLYLQPLKFQFHLRSLLMSKNPYNLYSKELHLDIFLMIPANITKNQYPDFFEPLGTYDELSQKYDYLS